MGLDVWSRLFTSINNELWELFNPFSLQFIRWIDRNRDGAKCEWLMGAFVHWGRSWLMSNSQGIRGTWAQTAWWSWNRAGNSHAPIWVSGWAECCHSWTAGWLSALSSVQSHSQAASKPAKGRTALRQRTHPILWTNKHEISTNQQKTVICMESLWKESRICHFNNTWKHCYNIDINIVICMFVDECMSCYSNNVLFPWAIHQELPFQTFPFVGVSNDVCRVIALLRSLKLWPPQVGLTQQAKHTQLPVNVQCSVEQNVSECLSFA